MQFEAQTLLHPLGIKVLVVPVGYVPPDKWDSYLSALSGSKSIELQTLTYENLEQSGTCNTSSERHQLVAIRVSC